MSHQLKWESKGVYWKYSGHVSGEEVIDASTIIYGDPRFDNLRYKLVDFLDVELFEMTETDMLKIAAQHNVAIISNPRIKNALIYNSHTKSLTEKFCDFFKDSSWDVRAFQNLNEANNWLNREEVSS